MIAQVLHCWGESCMVSVPHGWTDRQIQSFARDANPVHQIFGTRWAVRRTNDADDSIQGNIIVMLDASAKIPPNTRNPA